MTQRDEDLALLTMVLEKELPSDVRTAFEDMREQMTTERGAGPTGPLWVQHSLSPKQRDWVRRTGLDHVPQYENLYSAGKVPRGREVVVNTGPLPKRPPPRSSG